MKWALILAGGGAKGFAHASVIRFLEKNNYPRPALVAGTSMGAIIAALYAYGWDSSQIYDYILQFKFTDFLENKTFKLPALSISRILQAGTAVGSVLKGRAIDSGDKALEELKKLFGNTQFEELKLPFACVAVDLLSGKPIIQNTGSVAEALRASMSYPCLFEPVARDNMLLVDGGVLNNVPCDIAYRSKIYKILAVNFGSFKERSADSFDNGIDVLMRCYDIASSKAQSPIQELAKLSISLDSGFTTFNFNKAPEIISRAEELLEENTDRLDRFFHPGLSYLYHKWKKSKNQPS